MNLKATNINDVFPCLCYETKMAQGRDIARSHCCVGMNLLSGQLSFPQSLGRDGPWPPVGSQDASVSCSDINHAKL